MVFLGIFELFWRKTGLVFFYLQHTLPQPTNSERVHACLISGRKAETNDTFDEGKELAGTWAFSLRLLQGIVYALTSFNSNRGSFPLLFVFVAFKHIWHYLEK